MKKLLLTLGAIASVAAPVAAVVACGSDKPVTPAKTAPSKTHEVAPKAQPEDEGFTEGSLIENFDIDAESQKIAMLYDMEYEGKTYTDLDNFIKAIEPDYNTFLDGSILKGMGYASAKIENKNGLITIEYFDSHKTPQSAKDFAKNPKEMVDKMTQTMRTDNTKYSAWTAGTSHQLITRPEKKLSALKHPMDSIIYSQAQSLTNTVDTKGDTATFSTASKALDVIAVPAGGYTEAITNTKAGSFKKGDSITFAFDKERDLKSFTQRVGYLDAVKAMFASDTVANHTKKLGILDGIIYSYEARDGAPDKTKSIFKLEVVAKNAVKLTFINPDQGMGPDKGTNQFLMLNGFKDINGDGIITSDDKGISKPFNYK